MPIKFRCQHCRQFLGISRSKAGEIFDCPTCGWTLRVPDLNGTVRPLPDPGLNMEDSKLAQALDELASMDSPAAAAPVCRPANSAGGTGIEGRVIDDRNGNDGRDSRPVQKQASSTDDSEKGSSLPAAGVQTMPEPIELPVLPAPEPIDIEPRFRANRPVGDRSDHDSSDDDDSSASARPWRSTAPAGKSWKRLLAAAEFGLTEGDSTDEPVKESGPLPASGVATSDSDELTATDSAGPQPVPATGLMQLSGSVRFALLGVATVIFAIGFWIGRVTTLPASTALMEEQSEQPGPSTESSAPAVMADEDTERSAFRGRITFRTESGERKPDSGATVIVLPAERQGTARLPTSGWRAGDTPEDQRLAQAAIRTLGGDATVANYSGEFEIKLRGAGQFLILALSNSLSRDADSGSPDVEENLARYFDRPSQVLGRVMYQFEKVHYSGDGVTPWDYSFGQM